MLGFFIFIIPQILQHKINTSNIHHVTTFLGKMNTQSIYILKYLPYSLPHQQDALPRQGFSLTLFNFDDALTKREQIPNEMGLGCGKRERVNVKKP